MNARDRESAIVLGMLQAIDARSDVTQRHLADQLGVALGLANSYLKRCVRKGLVKIHQAPANRYLYYLTPEGFVEKTRLTADYLRYSLDFYRRASESIGEAFATCESRNWARLGLYGCSELAEIAAIRASEHQSEILCVVDSEARNETFVGLPRFNTVAESPVVDAWLFTCLTNPIAQLELLHRSVDPNTVIMPSILSV